MSRRHYTPLLVLWTLLVSMAFAAPADAALRFENNSYASAISYGGKIFLKGNPYTSSGTGLVTLKMSAWLEKGLATCYLTPTTLYIEVWVQGSSSWSPYSTNTIYLTTNNTSETYYTKTISVPINQSWTINVYAHTNQPVGGSSGCTVASNRLFQIYW